jgi:hypothetical protein
VVREHSSTAALTCSALSGNRQQIVPGTCSSCCTLYLLSLHCALLTLFLAPPSRTIGDKQEEVQRDSRTAAGIQQRYYLHSHLCTQECMAVTMLGSLWLRVQRQQCRGVSESPAGSLRAQQIHCSMHTAAGTLSRTPVCLPVACGSGLWWGGQICQHMLGGTDCSVGKLGHGGIT